MVTHTCTVLVYFIEKDLYGAEFPGFDEKYLAMAERLVLAMCFLFPNPIGAVAIAGLWLGVMFYLRRHRMFEKQSLNILKTYVKNLKEAVELTQKAGKNDEVAQLQYEIGVVSEYLPAEADIASVTKVVEAAIAKVNPQGPQDFGKIMKEVMSAGLNADGNVIKQIVNEKMKK
jgi:uncharacterized protein YqeY